MHWRPPEAEEAGEPVSQGRVDAIHTKSHSLAGINTKKLTLNLFISFFPPPAHKLKAFFWQGANQTKKRSFSHLASKSSAGNKILPLFVWATVSNLVWKPWTNHKNLPQEPANLQKANMRIELATKICTHTKCTSQFRQSDCSKSGIGF